MITIEQAKGKKVRLVTLPQILFYHERITAANIVFIKFWPNFNHSTINRYFAFVVNGTGVLQIPQLHKHFNVRGNKVTYCIFD
jgi:hypothetical protein